MVGDTNPSMGGQKPLSSDWLYWHFANQQGAPIGPAPPMFVDDPRYTGENVYDPPFQYQNARLTGPAYGQETGFGAKPGGGGGLFGGNEIGEYPSGDPDSDVLVDVSGDGGPSDEDDEGSDGLSDLDKFILEQQFRETNSMQANNPDSGGFGNPDAFRTVDLSREGRDFLSAMSEEERMEYMQALRGGALRRG
jgi:hypothetical protein